MKRRQVRNMEGVDATIAALRRLPAPAPAPPARPHGYAPPLLRSLLATGHTVQWGALLLKGWWAKPEQITYLEGVMKATPGGTRWLRLGGPGSPFTAEASERLPEVTT